MVAIAWGMSSCNSDDEGVPPTVDLSIMNFRSTEQPGSILLEWDVPEENPGYFYMKMHYYDPREKKDYSIIVSPYTKSLVIENTRKRYGAVYDFTFTPYSETDTPGEPFTLEGCTSGAAEKTVSVERIPLNLDITRFVTNSQDPGEGQLAGICDGNKDTFFHTSWRGDGKPYHWIDVDLGEEVDRFEIDTWNRKGAGANYPNQVKLYNINAMEDPDVDMDAPFYTYDHPNKTSGAESVKMIPAQEEPALTKKVRYLRYCPDGTGGSVFWHIAEFAVSKVIITEFDPEEDEKPVYDVQ